MLLACLDEEEVDPRNVEIPESGANSERRHINLANVLGGQWMGKKELGKGMFSHYRHMI